MDFLQPYDSEVAELALELRALVLREAPMASEIVFSTYILSLIYTFTGRPKEAICYIGVYARHVNLGFTFGTQLADPEGLLQGEGKSMRHLRLEHVAEVRKPYVRKFLRAAIKQVEGVGPASKHDRPQTIVKVAKRKRWPGSSG